LFSELAASIAHEVRNPLTVVRGFVQLLHNKLEKQDKKQDREYMDISIKEIDGAERIISDYLNFGTGLGMMVTFRLVEALNGSLDIHSTVDKGTEVFLKLPASTVSRQTSITI
jgi:signal transduction histidine kinase